MGLVKNYYIDKGYFNTQRFVSSVKFTCPKCRKRAQTNVVVPEPNFSAESDKSSDMQSEDTVEVVCNHCNSIFDGYAHCSHSHCEIELTEHKNTDVSADIPYYSPPDEPWDYEEYIVPSRPHGIFKDTISELKKITDTLCDDNCQNVMNRMVFAQTIAAFEAYYCDTLIIETTRTDDMIGKAITRDENLRGLKLTLEDIFKADDIVKKTIKHAFKNALYHNIDQVSKRYRILLGIEIIQNDADLTNLKEAILYRHDCVHRNGKDKEDNDLQKLKKDYILETLTFIERLADNTQSQIEKINKSQIDDMFD
jgi:hypothetical protein